MHLAAAQCRCHVWYRSRAGFPSLSALEPSLHCISACLDVVPSTYVIYTEEAQQILKGALQSARYKLLILDTKDVLWQLAWALPLTHTELTVCNSVEGERTKYVDELLQLSVLVQVSCR